MELGGWSSIKSGPYVNRAPTSSSFVVTALRWFGLHRSTRTVAPRSPARAAATRNVPASIRSGIVVISAGCNSSTPSMTRWFPPTPSIFAPILTRNSPNAVISGSIAALSMTVVPLASTAAIITLPVAPTLETSKTILAPFSLDAFARIYPASTSISAPSFRSPSMCRFTGRGPQAHPPGSDTRAWPYRATSGPST